MQKNVAGSKVQFFAFDTTTGAAKTGDAANITGYVDIDSGGVTVLGDTSATEIDSTNAKGWYQFDLTQGETNGNDLLFTGKSSTANISVVGFRVQTTPAAFMAATFPSGTIANTTNITAGVITTVTTVTNQLTSAQVATGVWQDATAGDFTTASSIGKSLYTAGVVPGGTNGLFIAGTNAATTITTSLTTTFTGSLTGNVNGNVGGNVTGSTGSVVGAVGSVTGAVGSVTGNVGGNVTGSVGSVVGAVGSVTGSVGSVTGSVGSVTGSVGSVVGLTASNLDTTISSRMATYTQPSGFLAATFPTGTIANTTNITAGTLTTVTTATNLTTNNDKTGYTISTAGMSSISDNLLDRDMSTGTDSGSPTVRTPRQALRALRNRVSTVTGIVTKEDDTTTSWTFSVTTDASAEPITVIDPA